MRENKSLQERLQLNIFREKKHLVCIFLLNKLFSRPVKKGETRHRVIPQFMSLKKETGSHKTVRTFADLNLNFFTDFLTNICSSINYQKNLKLKNSLKLTFGSGLSLSTNSVKNHFAKYFCGFIEKWVLFPPKVFCFVF